MWRDLWTPILIVLFEKRFLAKAGCTNLLPTEQHPHQKDGALTPSCPASESNLFDRPVIGILSHPGNGASRSLSKATSKSYIASSYVKFVESAGARVIPIVYNEPEEIIFHKLKLVNGVLFTGGRAKDGLCFEIVEKIFKKVLERNDAGDHFPLYAICLGFELLLKIISRNKSILESFSALDQPSTLQFIENDNIEGTVFQRFPRWLLHKLSEDRLVMQHHRQGISPEKMQEHPNLSSFFKILTTSTDTNNKVYVSTVQARNYPVTAFQWHPEKNAFEMGLKGIPHSEDAIQVTQHVANFFISEARRSSNRAPAREVLDNLIYNYRPTYRGKNGRGFDQVYIFP